uniref:Uncharacterized protein n=1 Tax=Mastacembelus armatus TaxID=205130 RepID=A0A3Q3KIQ9_9TELE
SGRFMNGFFIGTYVRVERTFSCPYSCLRLMGNILLVLALARLSLPPSASGTYLCLCGRALLTDAVQADGITQFCC